MLIHIPMLMVCGSIGHIMRPWKSKWFISWSFLYGSFNGMLGNKVYTESYREKMWHRRCEFRMLLLLMHHLKVLSAKNSSSFLCGEKFWKIIKDLKQTKWPIKYVVVNNMQPMDYFYIFRQMILCVGSVTTTTKL